MLLCARCKNQNTQCDFWAEEGYCQTNSGFMIALCTQSCLECTVDPGKILAILYTAINIYLRRVVSECNA